MPIPPDLKKRKPTVIKGGKSRTSSEQQMASFAEFASAMAELNSKHAVVMVGGKCSILNETYDPGMGRGDITFSSPEDLKQFYSNRFVTVPDGNGGTKNKPLGVAWLSHPGRRTYNGIVFDPRGDPDGPYYNLWRGLAVEPEAGDWSLMQRHILEVICENDPSHYNYLMCWMSDAVRNPGGERSGVAVVLRGKKGTGKGIFVSALGEIFGSHFIHVTRQEHLTGKFNHHLSRALLVFCDEGFWAGDRSAEGALKGLITEKSMRIEPKGKDSFDVRNNVRLIIASNEDWVVPCTIDERRFFILNVSDAHQQDVGYFRAIAEQMRNGGLGAMLHDLLEWKADGVELRNSPKTCGLVEQIMHGMDSVHQWYYSRLMAGTLTNEASTWEPFETTQKLYAAYIRFCQDIGEKYPKSDFLFGKALRKIDPAIKTTRPREGYKRTYCLAFSPLEQARNGFEAAIGTTLEWEDDRDIDK